GSQRARLALLAVHFGKWADGRAAPQPAEDRAASGRRAGKAWGCLPAIPGPAVPDHLADLDALTSWDLAYSPGGPGPLPCRAPMNCEARRPPPPGQAVYQFPALSRRAPSSISSRLSAAAICLRTP
ncbi:unnamed protein product, partial [Amoebophrya sp. A120]